MKQNTMILCFWKRFKKVTVTAQASFWSVILSKIWYVVGMIEKWIMNKQIELFQTNVPVETSNKNKVVVHQNFEHVSEIYFDWKTNIFNPWIYRTCFCFSEFHTLFCWIYLGMTGKNIKDFPPMN